jgi:hypothetical protein
MRQISKSLILFLFMILVTSNVFARKPAVEPVTGLSIDQYDDVHPSKAKAYDFNNKKTKKLAPVKAPKKVKQTSLEQMKDKKSGINQGLVVLMVFLLPVAVWLGLMKGIKDFDEEVPNNVVDLNSKSNSSDDDDIDYPKAS